MPWSGRARPLQIIRNGVPDSVQDRDRRQLERNNEGHTEGGVRRHGGLPAELLCQSICRTHVFRRVRPHGPIRSCQRCGCCSHETS